MVKVKYEVKDNSVFIVFTNMEEDGVLDNEISLSVKVDVEDGEVVFSSEEFREITHSLMRVLDGPDLSSPCDSQDNSGDIAEDLLDVALGLGV